MNLFTAELVAGATLLLGMLAVYASPSLHPFVKSALLPRLAYGGAAVMAIIAACAFVAGGA